MMLRFYRLIYKFILSRRYRVTIKGLHHIESNASRLILPNHQSHIDPQIIAVEIYKYAEIVPVVNEKFFKIPFVGYFLRKWGGVPVSNVKSGIRDPNMLKSIFSKVIIELKKGKSVIIYPSGELQGSGFEKIKNKQGAYTIVADLPENTRVIGLKIDGLWGSSFSKAWDGSRPKFLPAFGKGIFYFFANLVFLCPKRDVGLEFVDITDEAREKSLEGRLIFNTYLEEFYNSDGMQSPAFIKHFFFFPKSKRKLPSSITKKNEKICVQNVSIG